MMNEVTIYGGRAKITEETLTVTVNSLVRTKHRVQNNRWAVLIGVIAFGFTIVGFFGQEGVSIGSIFGFILFLGGLVVLSLGIAFLLVLVVKRENPLKGGIMSSDTVTIPVQNLSRFGLVDSERNLAIEFSDEGTTRTMIIPFLTGMENERERLVTALESHARNVDDTSDTTVR